MPGPETAAHRRAAGARHGAVARITLVTLVTLAALAAAAPAQAGVEVAAQGDAALRPQLRDAAGVPVVDIARPDAHGVSQNAFTHFDVGAAGVVLNNAQQPAHSVLLGGAIDANAALRDGAAHLILAEVVGDAASSLRGAIEVAGTRADLIIANPNGIECDGCSFIGSARTVLAAAGVLRDAQGSVTALQTDGGVLRVGRRGLLADQVDRLELLARRVRVDGGVRAHELLASVGHLRQSYDGALLQAIEVPGAAPQFALDVAELGAMQAERIELRVTEKGAGVRHAGQLRATAGELSLRADGRLELSGAVRGGDAVQLRAARIDMLGSSVSAGGALRVDAGDALHASGAQVDVHGEIDVKSAKALRFARSRWKAGGKAAFLADTLSIKDSTLYGDSLDLAAKDHLDNAAGGVLHGEHVSLNSSWLHNAGSVHGYSVVARGGTLDNRGGSMHARSSLHLLGARIDNTRGHLVSLGEILLRSHVSLSNVHGTLRSEQALDLDSDHRIDNTSGRISAGRRLRVGVGESLHNDRGTMHSQFGAVSIDAPQAIVDNRDGRIESERGDLRLDVQQLINTHGCIAAPTTTLRASEVDNTRGSLRGEERLDGNVQRLRNAHGSVHGKSAALHIEQLENGSEGRVCGDVVELGGRLLGNLGGTLIGHDTLELRAPQLDNRGGVVETTAAAGALRVRGETIDNAGGTLRARGNADIVLGATLHNRRGTLQADKIKLNTGQRIDNAGGTLRASGDAVLDAARGIDNRGGTISAAGTLRLDSHQATLDNASGRIDAQRALKWEGRCLDNHAGSIGAERIELEGSELRNSGNGRLVAGGDLDATFAHVDNDGGLLQASGGALALRGGTLDNRGGRLQASAGLNTELELMREGVGQAAAGLSADAAR